MKDVEINFRVPGVIGQIACKCWRRVSPTPGDFSTSLGSRAKCDHVADNNKSSKLTEALRRPWRRFISYRTAAGTSIAGEVWTLRRTALVA